MTTVSRSKSDEMTGFRNKISSFQRAAATLLLAGTAFLEFLSRPGSARAAAAAVKVHATPRAADPRRLGIDPAAFSRIRRR
jgi:hypothetical protein